MKGGGNVDMWLVEIDFERTDSWTPLCGHRDRKRAEDCARYFRPMAAFSGKPIRVIPAPGFGAHQGAVESHGLQDTVPADRPAFPLCPRCHERPVDKALLGDEGEGHICGECWRSERLSEERFLFLMNR